MPSIQIDTGKTLPRELKQQLAQQIGDLYCEVMQARANIVSVVFRECGEDNLYRVGNSPPKPVVVITCDIRKGRPADQRTLFASKLVSLCEQDIGAVEGGYVVYFTEHDGEEIFRDHQPGRDWSPTETG